MNNVINKLLLTVGLLAQTAFASEDFDRGYALGFDQGWKQIKGRFSVPSVSPVPPIPKIGFDTFFGGYDQGFLDGTAKAENR